VADPVSRNPLLYDPATSNTVICVGTLLSVMTRGQKRSKELRHDADLSHQHLPPPPLVMEREDLVDSPEHDLRDTDVRQDATMRKNLTRPTPAPFTTQDLGGGERVTPQSLGTPDGNGSGSTSFSLLHEDIQAACQTQLLAVTIRVIWLVGFSVEVVLPCLVQ